ncbi:fluoride efflux transporter CrcB [Frankia sp. CNm7]|uniref:Fluoride-specific ion channel FluC n=1 Tax=Frankia nepalensis TaxID=1836974 RepID=A0A937UUX5_9ACTN|nr:fluoride efflux transporter CrcB [Frankia nepalensis]MBL7500153.1 fluoride efflux transporter CrcB [Frankia nepalensis]MBL7512384.1 fluoride efflux transporter CrcB [Frankia nepalensis]MBL7523917.1 fluoride efflux transporter CrcB [Frankia nepalensis]MBL7632700.1 fluoride efflux transporter CrcB [Frankia nepalensis]
MARVERTTGPTDSDVDLHVPAQRSELRRAPIPTLAVISAGGVLGSCARYGASLAWPTPPGAFPWTTWAVNVTGCAAIGVLMVLIAEVRAAHPLVRPFLGTGMLGGFTTFSTYAVDAQRLVDEERAGMALAYLVVTVLGALGAVWVAAVMTRRYARRRI